MDEEEVQCSCVNSISGSEMNGIDHQQSETRDLMLQSSAHLLGLLLWRIKRGEAMERSEIVTKLEKAEIEVAELKKRRSEDAKANEKVVSIFASQEQNWLSERKQLRRQIGSLLNELRVLETKKEEVISDLNKKIMEKELSFESRMKSFAEEEDGKRKKLELMLKTAEDLVKDFRETASRETKEHNTQMLKHKTALIELVSNQRQLEAEMGRALRQLEASKEDLDSVLKQKEDSVCMVQKLSTELIKMHKDTEQKDKIISAILRKSKIDSAEKEILLKELKISKSRRKQAELETERWRTLYGSRHDRDSSRNHLAYQTDPRLEVFSWVKEVHTIDARNSQHRRIRSHPTSRGHPETEAERRAERERTESKKTNTDISTSVGYNPHSIGEDAELAITADVKQLEDWIQSETEKNITMIEKRHHLETNAFAEQLRLKDEKLQGFNWRLLSMELESKRLQSHIEELNQKLSQEREENMKLEALLIDQETELKSLKEKLNSSHLQHSNSSPKALTQDQTTFWSKVKIVRAKPREREEERMPGLVRIPEVVETEKVEEIPLENETELAILSVIQLPEKEIVEVEKEVIMDPIHVSEKCASPIDVKVIDKLASVNLCLIEKKDIHPWKMDLHALGISYKIKRLKQQFLMLEKLTEMQASNDKMTLKRFLLLILPLLNKQVSRYQTLEESTNNLCKRMYDSNVDLSSRRDSSIIKSKEETKKLQHFLEETFQLQRYMVATGQKLMEIQSSITSELVSDTDSDSESFNGFNLNRFANSTSTLLKDVQRGLEVRISRIIGDLEGTMAFEGIFHLKNK